MAQLTGPERAFLDANVEGSVSRLLSDADRQRYKSLRAKVELDQQVYGRLVAAANRAEPPDQADVALLKATPGVCNRVADWLLADIAAGRTAALAGR